MSVFEKRIKKTSLLQYTLSVRKVQIERPDTQNLRGRESREIDILLFIITDKARAKGEDVKRCRWCETKS